jgi:replicative superfamily II helicase
LIIENTKDGIIEFFMYFRDDLFILSLKNEGWKPWMTPYSRFIVDDDFQLVQIFEKDANSESIEDEAVEEVEIESITNNRVEEMVAAELLLSSRIIQKMRDWADMSKVELHKFSKVSSLPLWDKTRIETEARYFFKRSHFNLESSIIEKYLTESLDLLSRIYTDLNSLNILLKSLKLNKIKQEFEDVHEFIDLIHEYHDLLSDQLSNLRLEKSFLESDMNLQVKKIWKNINGFCDSHDARKRINNGLEKIEKNKAIKKKKR